ncbi:heterokaryon incompatibility protein-domain-containing protein [Xylaria palmicola]|nr:heterokaryon incompatibility protein-domain-containing protein [Xylaria palmicola]
MRSLASQMSTPAVYQALCRERREFRLARIKPTPHGEQDDHLIEVTLEHASLNDPPSFTALSYTWGDNADEATILVNAIPIPTRRNLHAALYQLRKRALDDWIWIDVICIDQNDDSERSWQVNEMRSIFALADHVHCWLGPATDDSEAAFRMLKRIAQKVDESGWTMDDIEPVGRGANRMDPLVFSTPEAEDACLALCKQLYGDEELESKDGGDSRGAAVLQRLLHRSFFSRVWIIQEFSLAKQCHFLCGQGSLDLDTYTTALRTIELATMYRWRIVPRSQRREDQFFFPFNWAYVRSKPFEVRQTISSGYLPNLCNIILAEGACPERPAFVASDPRDIVFGLLGCVADAQSLGLQADYSKPINQVFAETTKAFIKQRRLYQLGHCSFLKDMPGLPSWVPDFKRLGELGGLLFPIDHSVPFAADYGLLDPPDDVDVGDWKILRTCGWYVDVVTAVMRPAARTLRDPFSSPYLSPEDQRRWLSEIVDFFQLDATGKDDEAAVWRALANDQQNQGERTTPVWQDLAPRVFRGVPLHVGELAPDQLEFIEQYSWEGTVEGFELSCLGWMEACCRYRTLFKTSSGKIGLGPEIMLAGDVVTILLWNSSPIILRPESEQYHSYVGGAYVHTIMDGEFAATEPELRLFDII